MAYTPEDVQNALAQNLINEQDAQYLLNALKSQGSGVGTALGAAAGTVALGSAGGALGQKAGKWLASGANKIEESYPTIAKGMNNVGEAMATPGVGTLNRGAIAGGVGGGTIGGIGGGMAGNAMTGGSEISEEELDMAIQLLLDPNVSERDKAAIMGYLQSQGIGTPEEGGENSGIPWGGIAGGTIGALGLGVAGGALARKAGQMIRNAGYDRALSGARGAGPMLEIGELAQKDIGMGGLKAGDLAGGVLGTSIGGVGGAMVGNTMFPNNKYQDPFQ